MNDVIGGIAKMLHARAFANLAEDPETQGALRGFDPGPSGDWFDTVPETPPCARRAAEYVRSKLSAEVHAYADNLTRAEAERFGHRLALHVLGTGSGLWDGDFDECPDVPFRYDEGYSYYLGDEVPVAGTIWAQAKMADPAFDADGKYRGGNWQHTACWTLDTFGGLEPAKESSDG